MTATLEPLRGQEFGEWTQPTFSMEERERRWAHVRELMRRDGIDCIVGLNSTGTHNRNQADVRYLTQLGNNCEEVAVCFPLDGKITAITNRGGYWPAGDWVGETKRSGRPVDCFLDIVNVLKPGATFGELQEAATNV